MTTEDSMRDEHLAIAFEANRQLRADLERETMRLVACDVGAMADTVESAAKARHMHADYQSAACNRVARRVDECIALRAENEALRRERDMLKHVVEELGGKFAMTCIRISGNEKLISGTCG